MNVTSALGWILGSSSASGAIDVVAVRQEDGSFTCSPFHVKLPVRSRTKEGGGRTVSLQVNGDPVKVSMRLGSAGEACFIIRNSHESSNEEASQANVQENYQLQKREGKEDSTSQPLQIEKSDSNKEIVYGSNDALEVVSPATE